MSENRIVKKKDIREFIDKGYSFCEHCSPVGKALSKESEWIEEFCKGKKMTYSYNKGYLDISTPYGFWRAVPSETKSGIDLWHQNGISCHHLEVFTHFHHQKYYGSQLEPVFRYIYKHDCYREQVPSGMKPPKINKNLPKGGKRYRAQQRRIEKYERKRDRINNLNNVFFLLEQISAKQAV